MNWLRRHRPLTLALFCLVLTFLCSFGYWRESHRLLLGVAPKSFLRLENYTKDFLQSSGRPAPLDPQLVYLGIGDASMTLKGLSEEEIASNETLQAMHADWPWNRSVYQAILDRLTNAGAKVVIFDLLFPTPKLGDESFQNSLNQHQQEVVLGSNFIKNTIDENSESTTLSGPSDSLIPPSDHPDSRVGYVNHFAEADGVIRRMRYRATMEDFGTTIPTETPQIYESLAAVTLRKLGHPEKIPAQSPIGFRFAGPAGTFRPHPVYEIFLPSLWKSNYQDGAFFKDKIVIVGPEGNFHQDAHPTAVDQAMPGPEIHLNAINAALQGDFLHESPFRADLLLIALAGLTAWTIGTTIHQPGLRLATLAAVATLYTLTLAFLYNRHGILTTTTTPLLLLTVGGIGCFFYDLILERIERQRLRRVLNVHLSRSVAELILADQSSFEATLAGQMKQTTILFSDIRGFSTWSETVTPTQLVAQLNEYFLGMVDPILAEDGTLLRFIGDAIFAAWGDTHSRGPAEDARRAVHAALGMRIAMARMNTTWRSLPERRELTTGIGLNHGAATVGQVGHPVRYEFSVMGDATNLAARLESATKQFHTDILVSASVVALTLDSIRYRSVDRIVVKGKTEAIDVFTPLSTLTEPEPPWFQTYEKAVALFRSASFQDSIPLFHQAQSTLGGEDFLCQMYLDRSTHFIQNPPPPDWDGSHTLSEK